MATVWSGYSGGIAVGIDVSQSPSTVTSSTSSVTLTWTIWARNDSTHGTGSYTYSTSGAKSSSGSGSGGYPSWGTTWKVTSFTTTVSTSYSGSVSSSLAASVTWTSTGATPHLTRTATVAKRPPAIPSAPTSVKAVPSTSSVTVSWTRPSNASSAGTIWTNAVVQRWTDAYVNASSWKTVATLSGTSTSWVDSSASSNHQYQYQVYAKNSSGSSSAPNSTTVQTGPAAPTSLVGTRSGTNIILTWKDNAPYNSSYMLEDSPDGSTWSTVTTSISGSATSYTHTNPSTSVTHRYRLTAKTSTGLSATSAVSNVVTILSAPAAPSGLTPSLAVTGSSPQFEWTHNPTDTSKQLAYQILWSNDGGATWTDTGKITSGTSAWTATAAVATAGTVQWQVRTWGSYADPGPYSAITNTTVSTSPAVTITSPGSSVNLSTVEVDWSYSQNESTPQGSWSVSITDDRGNVVATGSGTGTAATWTSAAVLQNNQTYTAVVTVTSTLGLTGTATQSFIVTYQAPLLPTVTLDDQISDGYISVTATANNNGVVPDTIALMIERSIDGGEWVVLWQDNVTSVTWRDYGCSLTQLNSYRVSSISALPSQAPQIIEYASPEYSDQDVVMISTGIGLTDILRFSYPSKADFTGGSADVVLNKFAGRKYQVPTYGIEEAFEIAVSAILPYLAQADDLEAQRDHIEDRNGIFYSTLPVLYRDNLGRRFFCVLSQPTVPSGYAPEISFTATQVDSTLGMVEGVVI